jgi:hypothetical protein
LPAASAMPRHGMAWHGSWAMGHGSWPGGYQCKLAELAELLCSPQQLPLPMHTCMHALPHPCLHVVVHPFYSDSPSSLTLTQPYHVLMAALTYKTSTIRTTCKILLLVLKTLSVSTLSSSQLLSSLVKALSFLHMPTLA